MTRWTAGASVAVKNQELLGAASNENTADSGSCAWQGLHPGAHVSRWGPWALQPRSRPFPVGAAVTHSVWLGALASFLDAARLALD